MDSAINNAVAAGITFAAAAGNENTNANSYSPANNPNVMAVSAMVDTDGKCGANGPSTSFGNDDTLASFSNYGSTVDVDQELEYYLPRSMVAMRSLVELVPLHLMLQAQPHCSLHRTPLPHQMK